MLESFFRQLSTEPETISFGQTITLIDTLYEFTPTAFRNGELSNAAGENNGSCKILAFALLHQLSEPQTLALFGDYYRLEVLPDIKGTNHANIRNFMRTGWDGVSFNGKVLQGKSVAH
ncbi:type III effector [Rheinheimera sp. SA_1]|uniref:HopJ type III effector protein n=1 Tax=Rheinheimera sp. SA_1 TaxID=1827365 RepID=UPI0007FB7A0A|nr:HopJ type III effector protein [Rheinheimera sp. SA_1]OBP15915.1 type III effector [Rheinheimera sp. SA_1]